MVRIARGNFAVIPVFEISKLDPEGNPTGVKQTYEFVSWRHGEESGAKGVVFVKKDGKITHFIILRGAKFATGREEFDTLGGFIEPTEAGVENKVKEIASREIGEELGLTDIKIDEVISLGKIKTDAGMTNNAPFVFAATINADEALRISHEPINLDPTDLKSGPLIFPIEQLSEVLAKNEDSFFAFTIAKAINEGILTLSPESGLNVQVV